MVGSPAKDGGHIYPMTSHELDTNQSEEKRGRPRMSWWNTINKDLKVMGVAWKEVAQIAEDRKQWKSCIALCVYLHKGRLR